MSMVSAVSSFSREDDTDERIVQARNMVTEIEHPDCGPMKLVSPPVKYSFSEPSIRSPPPTLGQHTDELLAGVLGLSPEEITSLKSEGIVA